VPKGPGTAGTLVGWLLFPFVRAPLSDPLFGALLLASFLFGILACERTGRALGVADHGGIVWDEIVAIWLVLWLTPPPWPGRPPPSCCSASSTSSSRPPSAGWTNAPAAASA
jgi:phosphatidylglycerophosphatase A